MAVTINGSGVVTGLASGNAGVGKILQVVQGTSETTVNTTSTSYVTTGLTATITPSLVTSKILILTHIYGNGNATDETRFTIFRGTVAGTNLGPAAGMGGFYPGSYFTVSFNWLDSPSTTSAQVYTLGFKNLSGAGTSRAITGNAAASITLMEVAA